MSQLVATHIELRLNRDGQPRAFIAGTRVRVQDIYAQAEIHGRTPEEIVEGLPHLSLGQVHAALSYLFDHRAEILNELHEDLVFVNELRKRDFQLEHDPRFVQRIERARKSLRSGDGVKLEEWNAEDRTAGAKPKRNPADTGHS